MSADLNFTNVTQETEKYFGFRNILLQLVYRNAECTLIKFVHYLAKIINC
jgi:hypothetical protein